MDPAQYNSQMQTIAYGEAFMAAAKDYSKELKQGAEQAEREASATRTLALKDLFDDPELERLHGERLDKLKEEREKRAVMERQGHGTYQDVPEATLMEVCTSTDKVVAHFWHKDFERCKIVDKHLSVLAVKYFSTRFVKVSAEQAPFLVDKLQVRMLPCIISFQGGIAGERLVGFDKLGNRDDFETSALEKLLLGWHVVDPLVSDSADKRALESTIRKGFYQTMKKSASDEDSDFSD
jgi:hypothetical protein